MRGTMTRSTTVQAVLTQLRRDIITEKFDDGTPVKEILFAEEYNCSRAALRGALIVLEQEGLIKVLPNGTKTISLLSKDDINNLYELRNYVECTAVKQLLQKENLDISHLIGVLEEAKKNPDINFYDSDAMFHEMLIKLSGNKALMQVWKNLIPVMRELFIINCSRKKSISESLEERHLLIAKLLFERDKKAVEELSKHIEEARILSIGK